LNGFCFRASTRHDFPHHDTHKNMHTNSVSVASVASASTATSHRGIRCHIKKQLAEDIESNGGIQYFVGQDNQKLYHLLQQKVEDDGSPEDHPYGRRGDKIRTQIRQLVQRWVAKNNEGRYVTEVLNPWQIVQHSARMPSAATPSKSRRRNSNVSLSSSESGSEDDSISGTVARNPPPTRFRQTNRRTPPRQVVVDSRTVQPTTPLTPSFAKRMEKMSINENKLKRKIGNFDLDNVASSACKCLGYGTCILSILIRY